MNVTDRFFTPKFCILLSILIHLLFFFPYVLMFTQSYKHKDIPYTYVEKTIPSYFYDSQPQLAPHQSAQVEKKSQPVQHAKEGLLNPKTVQDYQLDSPPLMQAYTQKQKPQDAIHLIGDKLEEDPLRNLLGRAITANLKYPKMAQELALRGTVTIAMTLFPSGEVVNIKMLKSSRHPMLDKAALNAIEAISPVRDVNLYLKAQKYLVINIIFGAYPDYMHG